MCEKFGDYERSLDYVDAALSSDIKRAGTRFPTSRVTSQLLRGRVLFSLGRTPEAAKTLEGAAGEAHKFGFRLYEAYALRDLKLFVLDDMGHGDHASRRLGAVLRLLKGPPEKLAPLLKGLDPAELMALPAHDAGYEVRYEPTPNDSVQVEEQAKQALWHELKVMKVKALKQRARSSGVDTEAIVDSDDADDVKAELIRLILLQLSGGCARTTTSEDSRAAHEAELRRELGALKMKALKMKAREAGVQEERLEDADYEDDPLTTVVELIVEATFV